MKKYLLFSLVIILLSGCVPKLHTVINDTPKNELLVANVGNSIYESIKYIGLLKIILTKDIKMQYENQEIEIPKNSIFRERRTNHFCNESNIVLNEKDFFNLTNKVIRKNDLCFNLSTMKKDNFNFDYTNATKGSFKTELIYSGITNNTIHMTYREFSNDFARPAFFQNLTYTLDKKKTIITFKNLEFQIIEASSKSITYKRLK